MKTIITQCDLLTEQERNQHDAELQLQLAVEKNMAKVNMPELKKVLKYSAREFDENKNKHNKSKSKLYIKNMVSIRCKLVVKAVLENLGLHYTVVELGIVEIEENLSIQKRNRLKAALLKYGLELMDDKKNILIEKIKTAIIEMIHYEDELPKTNISDYLSEKLNHGYTYMANLFSEVKGITIEHFILSHKIERVKELLVYNELTLSEIAWKLHYSSVAHLSSQFKKMTGLTPSHFKKMKQKRRIALENV